MNTPLDTRYKDMFSLWLKKIVNFHQKLAHLKQEIVLDLLDVFSPRSVPPAPSSRRRRRGWKLYRWGAPEIEYVGKDKARAAYELGCKVSIAAQVTGPKGRQPRSCMAPPCDDHTLRPVIEEIEKLTSVEVGVSTSTRAIATITIRTSLVSGSPSRR